MIDLDYTILPCVPGDEARVDDLLDAAFGIGRRTKTSYRLREGEVHLPGLCFVAQLADGELAGVISFWRLRIGDEGREAVLLGPLAVLPRFQSAGLGLALMRHGLAAVEAAGHELVLLVGDAPYYGKVGFKPVPVGRLRMPGPVDADRLLYLELVEGAFDGAHGEIRSPSRFDQRTAPLRSSEGSR